MLEELKVFSGWEGFFHRPSLYIGKPSLYGLQCFNKGLIIAKSTFFFDDIWGSDFELWVRENKGGSEKSFDLALVEANSNDQEAFVIWEKWFREWNS
jgi:hypothetical protein